MPTSVRCRICTQWRCMTCLTCDGMIAVTCWMCGICTCYMTLQKLRHISSIGCLRRTVRSWHGLIVLRHPIWLSGTHHNSWMENSRNAGSMCPVLLPSMMRHAMRCVTITSAAIVASAGMLMCIPSPIHFTNPFYYTGVVNNRKGK
jgi:hypothetical protein